MPHEDLTPPPGSRSVVGERSDEEPGGEGSAAGHAAEKPAGRAAEKPAATIGQVAESAGVSRATVSRVMNGRATVAPDIADRVRAAVRDLDYTPSTLARSLSLGRTNTVALVMPDLANPMFQQVLRGVTQAAARDGYRVLVADFAENAGDEEQITLDARRRCDAVVLCAPRVPADRLGELIARVSPSVVINRAASEASVPALSVDHAAGIEGLVDHLLALNHTRFLFLAGPDSSYSDRERRVTLTAIAAAHPEISIETLACGATIDDGYRVAADVAASDATAVVAFNDLVAIGLLGRLAELGVAVPRQLSVTGFDDIPFARFATPPLTTMTVPQMEIGRRAWAQLHLLLTGGTPEPATVFQPRLVERASTGPARAAGG